MPNLLTTFTMGRLTQSTEDAEYDLDAGDHVSRIFNSVGTNRWVTTFGFVAANQPREPTAIMRAGLYNGT